MSRIPITGILVACACAGATFAAGRVAAKTATDVETLQGSVEGTTAPVPKDLDKLQVEALSDEQTLRALKLDATKIRAAVGLKVEPATVGTTPSVFVAAGGVRLTPSQVPVRKVGLNVVGRIIIAGQWPGPLPLAVQNSNNLAFVRPGGIIGGEFFPGAEPGWTPALRPYMIELIAPGLPAGPRNVLVNGYPLALYPAGAGRWCRVISTAWPALCIDLRPVPTWTRFMSIRLQRMS